MPESCNFQDRLDFSPEAVTKRPGLATLIARVNAEWSRIDVWIAVLLVRMVAVSQMDVLAKTSSERVKKADLAILAQATLAGASMYLALSGTAARDALLQDSAKRVLDAKDQERLEELFKSVRAVRRRRNAVAHGIVGIDPSVPDTIVVHSLEEALLYATGASTPRCFVYRAQDLVELAEDISKLSDVLDKFNPRIEPPSRTRSA